MRDQKEVVCGSVSSVEFIAFSECAAPIDCFSFAPADQLFAHLFLKASYRDPPSLVVSNADLAKMKTESPASIWNAESTVGLLNSSKSLAPVK